MPAEINYQFVKKLERIDEDINSWVEYTTGNSVVLDLLNKNYIRLQSDWGEICDWADENYIPTIPYWDKISEIRKNLGFLNEFIAKAGSNQININGNVTGSTVIVGNNNNVRNKK